MKTLKMMAKPRNERLKYVIFFAEMDKRGKIKT